MVMIYMAMGVFAFLLFVLYDINSILLKFKLLYSSFFVGLLLLAAATFGIIVTSWKQVEVANVRTLIFGFPSVLCFYLLIYTLFFAIPFSDTYIDTDASLKVCKTGVYALCRHPGVLWFMGFYVFLGLSLNIPLLLVAGITFSILNILYVIFQDQWAFIRTFDDYATYQSDTPFLIPNLKSIKHCFKTL